MPISAVYSVRFIQLTIRHTVNDHHTLVLPCECVLKATKQVNGKAQNSTPRHTKTPQPICTKIGMHDYVVDSTRDAKI